MKKIALVTSGGLPIPASRGGAVESLIDLLISGNELSPNYEIDVFSIYDANSKEMSKEFKRTTFIYLEMKPWINVMIEIVAKFSRKVFKIHICKETQFLMLVKKALKNKSYDYILIENRSNFVLPIKKIADKSCKIIYHIHNDYLNKNSDNAQKILEACDLVITVSEFLKRIILDIDSTQDNGFKVKTLYNCIDMDIYEKKESDEFRANFRSENNIKDSDVVIAFCGRLNEVKGLRELLQAFNSITQTDYKLLIIGSSWFGSSSVTPYIEEVKLLSKAKEKNIFFTDYVPHKDIGKYYRIADIAVVPSIWDEPAGLVIIEALASGLPLIASKKGGIPEYADDKCALFIEANDQIVNNLKVAIETLVPEHEERESMRTHGLAFVQQFSKNEYWSNFVKLLNEVFY